VPATVTGTGTIENPLYVSAADGLWTNYELQSTSRAIRAGSSSRYPTMDFAGKTRLSPPAIGALEAGSASLAVQVTVSAEPSTATLEQPITLTATVAQTGSSVPTGSINFVNASVSLGQASLDNEGTATLVVSSLPVGSYKVIADYSGDSNYPASESGYVSVEVLSATQTNLVVSSNPVTVGEALTLSATVEEDGGAIPVGTVNFLSGSTLLGTETLNASGVASLSTTSLAAGVQSLKAEYTGSATFEASTSPVVSETVESVTSPRTTATLEAYENPITSGSQLTLKATVKGSGSVSPTGTVSLLDGSTLLGTATLNSSGTGMLYATSLSTGTHSLKVKYSGSASFSSSTSTAISVVVKPLA
jgi:hypothetical protein